MSYIRSQFNTPLGRLPRRVVKPLPILGYVHDDVDGSVAVGKLLEKSKAEGKMIELFKNQLLLPVEKRSAALLKRFGINPNTNGSFDGWPTTSSPEISFFCHCSFPVDKSIPDIARVRTKQSILGLFNETTTGNSYYFYFPLSKFGVSEDNLYKLDGLNTWIFEDGSPDRERGDYTVYCALYDSLHGINAERSSAWFRQYGSGYSGNTNAPNLQLRGVGFNVTYFIKNGKNKALELLSGKPEANAASNVEDIELEHELPPLEDLDLDYDDFVARLVSMETPPIVEDTPDDGDSNIDEEPVVPPDEEPVAPPAEDPKFGKLMSTEEALEQRPNNDFFKQLAGAFPGFRIKFNEVIPRNGHVRRTAAQYYLEAISADEKTVTVVENLYIHPKQRYNNGLDRLHQSFVDYNTAAIAAQSLTAGVNALGKNVTKFKERLASYDTSPVKNFRF